MMNPDSHSRWRIVTSTESNKHSGRERVGGKIRVGTKWETSIITKNHPWDFFSMPIFNEYIHIKKKVSLPHSV
jgi:hypothetical protein